MKIVYTSNTGFTESYAKRLASKLGIEALTLKDALSCVEKNSNIIYLGWINTGYIEGLNKARKHFNPVCVCGVGLAPHQENHILAIRENNDLKLSPFFYLEGGFDFSLLKGLNKLKMKIARSLLKKSITKKENPSDNEKALLEILYNGANFMDLEKVDGVANWYYSRYII